MQPCSFGVSCPCVAPPGGVAAATQPQPQPSCSYVQNLANLMRDVEIVSPLDDTVSSMSFSPAAAKENFLAAGSWDSKVRCWEIQDSGTTIPKAMQSMGAPVLDVCWTDDGSKVFMAGCDKNVTCWDLNSNQTMQVGAHDAPVKTCHWIRGPSYSCLMTGSWDKTIKFWDCRSSTPSLTLNVPERVYFADVMYPMAVVGLGSSSRDLIIYRLETQPHEYKKIESPLTFQNRCVAIFRDQHNIPAGFAVGSVEGRAAIHFVNPVSPKDNFVFKCHRNNDTGNGPIDIYAVNDIAFHPVHGTFATVGSDGVFSFWDRNTRTNLLVSQNMGQPITSCCFSPNGRIFAYSVGYDWSKGHEFYNPSQKTSIFLRACYEQMKVRRDK